MPPFPPPSAPPAAVAPHAPLVSTALLVRTVHVLAASAVVGGGALTWWRLRVGREATTTYPESHLLAVGYEWLFWASVGLLVATGVGNLGALAPRFPGSPWSAVLAAKLLVVLSVLFGSLARTFLLVEIVRRAETPHRDHRVLERGYALTVLALVATVLFAEVLAHG